MAFIIHMLELLRYNTYEYGLKYTLPWTFEPSLFRTSYTCLVMLLGPFLVYWIFEDFLWLSYDATLPSLLYRHKNILNYIIISATEFQIIRMLSSFLIGI
jgi:hypothetical protein